MKQIFTFIIAALCLGSVTAQTNIYVSASTGDDTADGTTWATAYQSLDQALDQLNGVPGTYNIYLAQGKYLLEDNEGTGGVANEEYQISSGQKINIYGGYPSPYPESNVAMVASPAIYTTALYSENTSNTNSAFRFKQNATGADFSIQDLTIINVSQGGGLDASFLTFDGTTGDGTSGNSFSMNNVTVNEWGGGDAGFIYVYDSKDVAITIENSLIERSSNADADGQFIRVNNGNRNIDVLVDNTIVRNIRGVGLDASIFYINLSCDVDQGESSLEINNSKFLNIKRGRAAGQAAAVITARRLPYLKLNNNIFQGNTGGNGGAIQFDESGEFRSSDNLYQDNYGGQSAGAVWIRGDYPCASPAQDVLDIAEFKNDQFISNKSGIDGLSGRGGAIHIANDLLGDGESDKAVTISGSEFLDNTTSAYDGGAIFAHTSEPLIIENSTFCNNRANIGYPAQVDGSGGAIFIRGSGDLSVSGSTFVNNRAESSGGAIAAESTGSFIVDGCSYFADNVGEFEGGALDVNNVSNFSVDGATFENNIAEGDSGGAINIFVNGLSVNVANATFNGNYSQDFGGAIYSLSDLILNSVTFDSNSSEDEGGAIYANNDLDITNANFNDNFTLNGSGGAIYLQDNRTLDFSNVNFIGNKAFTTGGSAVNAGGGAIYVAGSSSPNNILNITNGYFENNQTLLANTNGGAIFSNDYGINTNNVVFKDNTATNNGGAIYLNVSNSNSFNLSDARYITNDAGESGGAIYFSVDDDGTINVNGNEFVENNAGTQGGAITVDSQDASRGNYEIDEMNNNKFYGNTLGGTNANNTTRNQRSDIMLEYAAGYYYSSIATMNNNALQFEATQANYPTITGAFSTTYGYFLGTGNTQQTAALSTDAIVPVITVQECIKRACPIKEETPYSPIVVSTADEDGNVKVNAGDPTDYQSYTVVNKIANSTCVFYDTEVAFSARSNNVPDSNDVIIPDTTPELRIIYELTKVNLLTGESYTTTHSIDASNADRVEDPSDEIPSGESGDLIRDTYKTYYLNVKDDVQPGYTNSYAIVGIETLDNDGNVVQSFDYTTSSQIFKTDLVTAFCPCTIGVNSGTENTKSTQVGISTLNRNTEEWLGNDNALGAYIALESTTKGLVIPRYENQTAIENGIGTNTNEGVEEGMIVWDNAANCIKMFYDHDDDASTPIQWHCISTETCTNTTP